MWFIDLERTVKHYLEAAKDVFLTIICNIYTGKLVLLHQ